MSASGSIQNTYQEIDQNSLAFPILSWNSPDPDPRNQFVQKYNPKQNINLPSDNIPIPATGSSSQPASFFNPVQLPIPTNIPLQQNNTGSIKFDIKEPFCYNCYSDNYSKV